MTATRPLIVLLTLLAGFLAGRRALLSAQGSGPAYLDDRGSGVPASIFGTYIGPRLSLGNPHRQDLGRIARLFLAIEGGEGGAPDEADFIAGLQWRIADRVLLKFDNQVGLQPKSPDWVPQLGVMLSFKK